MSCATDCLTGAALLAHLSTHPGFPRSEVVTAAGYTRPDGQPAYTAFYEAVLSARGAEAPETLPGNNPPRVYVASLSDYNAGILYGRWIDLARCTTPEEIAAEIAAMLAESPTAARYGEPAEEWAFHDSENCTVDEYDSLPTLEAIAESYAECQEERIDWGLFRQWQNCHDEPGSVEQFSETYQGAYDSGEDFAQELIEDICDLSSVPEIIRYRIDYEGIWRDLELGGDYYELRHGYRSHIFRNA